MQASPAPPGHRPAACTAPALRLSLLPGLGGLAVSGNLFLRHGCGRPLGARAGLCSSYNAHLPSRTCQRPRSAVGSARPLLDTLARSTDPALPSPCPQSRSLACHVRRRQRHRPRHQARNPSIPLLLLLPAALAPQPPSPVHSGAFSALDSSLRPRPPPGRRPAASQSLSTQTQPRASFQEWERPRGTGSRARPARRAPPLGPPGPAPAAGRPPARPRPPHPARAGAGVGSHFRRGRRPPPPPRASDGRAGGRADACGRARKARSRGPAP